VRHTDVANHLDETSSYGQTIKSLKNLMIAPRFDLSKKKKENIEIQDAKADSIILDQQDLELMQQIFMEAQ
jgi:nicotinate-nucleotide pyrophosphorylase